MMHLLVLRKYIYAKFQFLMVMFVNAYDGARRDHMVIGFTITCVIGAHHH